MSSWAQITSFANLCRAAKRAARHKRRVRGAARFLERLEPEALALQTELESGTWRPSKPSTFTIHDPKERVISAAPFRDRVVHHALIDPLEETLDATLLPETFACRRGKGTHAALRHAQELVRRHAWFVKLDIQKCFESIEHRVVLVTLAPLGLDARIQELCARILAGSEGVLGRGLPIGNLTSQWFANLVLGRLDRFALGLPGVEGYARYMDDFVLCGTSKHALRGAHRAVAGFSSAELHLQLKERASVLAPSSQGLPFLGWRIYPGIVRIRRENLRRLRRRVRLRRWELAHGILDEQRILGALRAVAVHLGHGDTLDLRRAWLAPIEIELGSGSPAPRTA